MQAILRSTDIRAASVDASCWQTLLIWGVKVHVVFLPHELIIRSIGKTLQDVLSGLDP